MLSVPGELAPSGYRSELPDEPVTETGAVGAGGAAAGFDLDDAYAVRTPEDNRRLYGAWADSYESGFVEAKRYVYHRRVAELFVAGTSPSGPVLDVGCGTGIVGAELREHGLTVIDGIDISPEMLELARLKQDRGGRAVYRNLINADLTSSLPLADRGYAGLVSAGTFTHGHLGPGALAELLRVAASGARLAIGVNAAHWIDAGFPAWWDAAVARERIAQYRIETVPVYEDSDPANLDDYSHIVLCQVI